MICVDFERMKREKEEIEINRLRVFRIMRGVLLLS